MKRDELNERLDLSVLDPFSDSRRAESFVRGVLWRSSGELARRRRLAAAGELPLPLSTSVFSVLAGWARPALAAAMLAAVASVLALQLAGRVLPEANAGVVEALAVPTPVLEWLVEERAPATSDLLLTLEAGAQW